MMLDEDRFLGECCGSYRGKKIPPQKIQSEKINKNCEAMLNIKRTMEYFQLIPPVVNYSHFDKRLLKISVSNSPILTNWSVSLPNIGIKTSQI